MKRLLFIISAWIIKLAILEYENNRNKTLLRKVAHFSVQRVTKILKIREYSNSFGRMRSEKRLIVCIFYVRILYGLLFY